MSSEKHPNLQLHKWAPTDYVKREEWNENFGIIDDRIGILFNNITDLQNQKSDKTYVDDQLSSKRDKATKITNADLDISEDDNKIKLINLSDEVLQAMTGTTPVNSTPSNNSTTREKIAIKAVHEEHLSETYARAVPSTNLFNKDTVLRGYYVNFLDGQVKVPNQPNNPLDWTASDFIAIKPDTQYTVKHQDQIAFYDINRQYISGIGYGGSSTFTTPSNAVFMRITTRYVDLNTQQINEGTTLLEYETNHPKLKAESLEKSLHDSIFSIKENQLDINLSRKLNANGYLKSLEIDNPFVRSNIKLVGDSITAGLGGTGYSPTGDIIFVDHQGNTKRSNVYTAVCWANMLKTYIEAKYNREFEVAPNSEYITITASDAQLRYYSQAKYGIDLYLKNLTPYGGVKFRFYGDHFSVFCFKVGSGGILDVYVDGVKHSEIDTYGSFALTEYQITGLSTDYHDVEIRQTHRKNASSAGYDVYIEYFKIPKIARVKNFGISGITSDYAYLNKEKYIEADDDIIIMQLGTNDRNLGKPPEIIKSYQREFIKYALSQNKKVVAMSACPSTVDSEHYTNPPTFNGRSFYMLDVDTAVRQVAMEMNVGYISNYDAFLQYTELRGVDISTLLADGLHPNDEGYKIMYRNIVRKLGLSVLQDGMAYALV
jgi:lysophospholipase L1-like esterase